MSRNTSSGYIDFNFLKEGSHQKNIFMNTYKDFIKDPLSKGALWVGGGGAYGSTRLSKHQMAISLGSSAGLAHSHDRDSKFLNKSEVGFVSPPNHIYSSTNKPKGDTFAWEKVTASISQGPSFNTIHINKHEDNATKKFLEWFFTNKKGQDDSTTNTFAKNSQYIVPMKGAFDTTSVIGKMVSGNTHKYQSLNDSDWGLKMGFETIRRQLDNDKLNTTEIISKVFEPPVDDSTGAIRKVIDSKIQASSNSFGSGGGAYSASSIWAKIHQQAVIDNVIEGQINRKKYIYPNQMNRNFSDINWNRYQYIDAVISNWTDGDTPNVVVTKTAPISLTSPVKAIKPGDKLAIRIAGIDTPEAHIKLGEMKRKVKVKGTFTTEPLDEKKVIETIKKYRADGHPLAVYSRGHYNELHFKGELDLTKFNNWKNIYVDIQTADISTPDKRKIGYDPVMTDPMNPSSTFDFRSVVLEGGGKLVTDLATTEGYWGLKAGEYGRKVMPAGTHIRVATNGNKSYNRVVGSIFYGDHLEHNWSVEITKTGLTLPFIGDASAVTEATNIMWENGQAIADAFNYALSRKNSLDGGLFHYTDGSLDEHLKWLLSTHGATKYGNLLHKTSGESTIYDYMMYRNPIREPVKGRP